MRENEKAPRALKTILELVEENPDLVETAKKRATLEIFGDKEFEGNERIIAKLIWL